MVHVHIFYKQVAQKRSDCVISPVCYEFLTDLHALLELDLSLHLDLK